MIAVGAIDLAHSRDILEVAERFTTLKKVTAIERAGPCPSCGGDDRFSVNTRKQVFNCRGCGAKGDAIALVQLALGCSFAQAVEELAGSVPERRDVKPREPARKACEAEEAARLSRLALKIFDGAGTVRGTLAERYLVRWRNIDLDQIPDLDAVLRFGPRCAFGKGVTHPCLIALARHVVTDQPQAIQRTALTPDGAKIGRMSLGPTKGGAIKLWPDAEITTGLVVGEGLETTAAAATRVEHRRTLLQPAWALINRINLRDLPVLAAVESLTVLVDPDKSGDGQRDAAVCARRWADAGREVVRLTPKVLGVDFNDVVRGERA